MRLTQRSLAACALLAALATLQLVASQDVASPTGAASLAESCDSLPAMPAGATAPVALINAGGAALCGYWAADSADASAGTGGKPDVWLGRNAKCQDHGKPQCTVRYGMDFSYPIKTTPGTTYRARLTFTEVWWTVAGKRVFDVMLNGETQLAGIDPFAMGGGDFEPVTREFEFTASGDSVSLGFKAKQDNALVAAIEVFEMKPVGADLSAAAVAQAAASTASVAKAAPEDSSSSPQASDVADDDTESEAPTLTGAEEILELAEAVAASAAAAVVDDDGTCSTDPADASTCAGSFRSGGQAAAAGGAASGSFRNSKPATSAASASHLKESGAQDDDVSDDDADEGELEAGGSGASDVSSVAGLLPTHAAAVLVALCAVVVGVLLI